MWSTNHEVECINKTTSKDLPVFKMNQTDEDERKCEDKISMFMKMAVFWVETLVNFYQTTRCYNPEDSNLHTHRRENLKSYLSMFMFLILVICFI
jgi:hypothetical protein